MTIRDIKMREHNNSPKILSAASKLPKELSRVAILESKSKAGKTSELIDNGNVQQSPTEYASDQVINAEEWAGSKAVEGSVAGGKKLAVKSYEKLKERRAEKQMTQAVKPNEQSSDTVREVSKQTGEKVSEQMRIRLKPEPKSLMKESGKGKIKPTRVMKKTPSKVGKEVISKAAIRQQQTTMAAKKLAVQSAKNTQTAISSTKNTVKSTATGVRALAQAVVTTARTIWMALGAGGAAVVLILVIMLGVIGGAALSGSSSSAEPLSQEVLAYTSTIQRYANQYGIPNYVSVIQAIMMQESGGRGSDPMQASECPYNTRYGNSPNAITDPEYSIQVGIQYYADCLREASCESPYDTERLHLSWQGYNYGNGYISWAIRNHGGYSAANALQFSQEQAAAHGWSGYGDPEYVPHVQRYYAGGSLFAGLFGNDQIVTTALSQLGNAGGQKFWSWYGFEGRVEWCACFVSWCADQSGLIKSGKVPKFSLCSAGVTWFQTQNRWKDNTYTPTAGTIIFFDWGTDGNSDHVGIVEKCENGIVYTVEGNSGDAVRQRQYAVGSSSILGYGLLQ